MAYTNYIIVVYYDNFIYVYNAFCSYLSSITLFCFPPIFPTPLSFSTIHYLFIHSLIDLFLALFLFVWCFCEELTSADLSLSKIILRNSADFKEDQTINVLKNPILRNVVHNKIPNKLILFCYIFFTSF